MVDTLTLVVVGVVLYTLVAMALRMRGLLPASVRVQGPITTLHTKRGRAFLDWLARPKRFWRAWGNFGVGIALVVMVGSFLLVLFAGVQAVTDPQPTPLNEPRNVLAIPGVNQFLPLSAAVEILAGLLVGLVVHEGGHGLLCRVEDIDIDSMGLALLAFIPIGAFVEPDEESRERADRGAQTRMFAAGVTNNFAVTVVAFLLLFGPVIGSIAVVAGVPVGGSLPGSPAREAGIGEGDVITGVDGQSVANATELDRTLASRSDRTVEVSLRGDDAVEISREVVVTGATAGAPVGVDRRDPTVIEAVNGTRVFTEAAFLAAARNHTVATLETTDGNVTAAMGVYTIVLPDRAFAAAGPDPGTRVVVTAIDGERTVTHEDLSRVLSGTDPDRTVEVIGYVDGERRAWQVDLAADPDGSGAFLGVSVQPGVAGFVVDDFGVDVYPAGAFLSALGGGERGDALGGASFVRRAFLALTLPFASVTIPGLGYNFAGFVGEVTSFYTVTGPLSVLGAGAVFFLANLLFWTAWINLVIGQFNCIPAYPLDGGHILRTSTEAVVSRLPVADRQSLTRAVTTSISLVMLAGVLLMVFGPRLLT